MMNKPDLQNKEELQEPFEETEDDSDAGFNAPKRSPIRRKAKFRTNDFKTERKDTHRKRKLRSHIRDDFEF